MIHHLQEITYTHTHTHIYNCSHKLIETDNNTYVYLPKQYKSSLKVFQNVAVFHEILKCRRKPKTLTDQCFRPEVATQRYAKVINGNTEFITNFKHLHLRYFKNTAILKAKNKTY